MSRGFVVIKGIVGWDIIGAESPGRLAALLVLYDPLFQSAEAPPAYTHVGFVIFVSSPTA